MMIGGAIELHALVDRTSRTSALTEERTQVMYSLSQYFSTDFPHLGRINHQVTLTMIGYEPVEIKAAVLLDFDGGVKIPVFFIPGCHNFAAICLYVIEQRLALMQQAGKGISITAGFAGDPGVSAEQLTSSSCVFIYGDQELEPAARSVLTQFALSQNVLLTFRGLEYTTKRNQLQESKAFLCHDTRDKEVAARIALDLLKLMCTVWYDQYELKVGDSLREKIENGLKSCKKCIVLLSPHFLSNKSWTKREFDSIFTRENLEGKALVLPIWKGVGVKDVFEYSPSLADRFAITWDDSQAEEIIRCLFRAIMA